MATVSGYGNLDDQFSEYLRWVKWVVRARMSDSAFQ